MTPTTRDRIVNRALELFSSKGYGATSVREICEAAGITKPTLYHFYGKKEGVYRALVDDALERFRRDLVERLEAPGSAQERLRRVARAYFETARANRELMRFMMSLVYGPPGAAPHTDFHRFYEDMVDRVAAAAEEGVRNGELRPGPTEIRMLVFMGALGECVHGNLIAGSPELTPELADSLVDTILDGWAAARVPANGDGRSR